MKVAVDARMLKMSGIGTYIQNLMKNDCYNIALGNKEELKKFGFNGEIIEYNFKIYGIKEQLKFPYKELKKHNPDVLHVPHYNVPIFYRGKLIVTIHDLTHLIYPEFLPNKLAYIYVKFMMWIAIKKSSKIITDSENTKKDILKFFNVDAKKIEVIHLAAGEEFVKKDKKDIEYLYSKFGIPKDKKVLMYVGNLKPHKNLEKLLEAYSKITNIEDTRLLLVGKAFEKYDILEDKEKLLNIQDKVIHTGIVTQEELVDLYNLIDLFVFPSLYEGFGLPILEALSCGSTVICSNASSIPEVGGNIVEYFNPNDVKDMSEKIEEALNSESNKNEDNEIIKWLKIFKWSKTAGLHSNVFKNI